MKKYLKDLTVDDLNTFKYPNLMAEVKETSYSICTIADHIGLPRPYRKEDDSETWDKLTGRTEITADESLRLANLFGVFPEYLFGHELKVVSGQSAAYWRWLDRNREIDKEIERSNQIRKIEQELKDKPYLFEFVKEAVTLNHDEIEDFIKILRKMERGNHK